MVDAMQDKQAWRAHFKQVRSSIPAGDRVRMDESIAQAVCGMPEFAACELLLPYVSFGAEVDTRAIIRAAWDAGKRVALPRCVPGTRTMRWYQADSFDGLVTSSLGVDEPAEDPSREVDPGQAVHALVVVPGLTFDAQGYRMGYGGGFYDVFLQGFAGTSVGLCRSVQLVEQVPALDPHDLPVQVVVTDEGILRAS